MKARPKRLTWIAIALLVIAAALPAQVMLLYGSSPLEPLGIAAKLAPLNWVIMTLAPVLAWLLYRASGAALVVAPLLGLVVLQNNLLVARFSDDFDVWAPSIGTGVFFLMISPLFFGRLRQLLTHPTMRWWLTPRRKRTAFPVRVQLSSGEQSVLRSFDISRGGAFLVLDPKNETAARTIAESKRCLVTFSLGMYSRIVTCTAEIVRKTEASGHYPAGIGIRFTGMSFAQSRMLAAFCRS